MTDETPKIENTPEATEAEPTGENPNAEAAKYRRQLRETEAERDVLRGQLDAVRRHQVESLTGLSRPAALWAAGVELDALLDADGRVDPAKVAEAVRSASEALGLAPAPRTPRPDPSIGKSNRGPARMADAFKRGG